MLAKADFFEYLEVQYCNSSTISIGFSASYYCFSKVVSNALNVTNKDCDPALRDALKKVELLTQHRVGWSVLSKDFKLCSPFDGTKENDVANFFENVVGNNFEDVVQYNRDNREFEGVSNAVTIKKVCDIMTGAKNEQSEK